MTDKPESTSALRKLLLVGFLLLLSSVLFALEKFLLQLHAVKDNLPMSLLAFIKWDTDHRYIVIRVVSLLVALLLYRIFIRESWFKTEVLVTKGKFVPPWPYLVVAALIVIANFFGEFMCPDILKQHKPYLWQMNTGGVLAGIGTSVAGALFGALTIHSLWQKIFINRGLATNIACLVIPVSLTFAFTEAVFHVLPLKSSFDNEQAYLQMLLWLTLFLVIIIGKIVWSAVLYKKEGNLLWIMILMFLCALL